MATSNSISTSLDSEAKERRARVNTLLTETFNSVLRVEEEALNNRIMQGLSISEVHTIAAVGLHEENPMSVVASRLGVTLATVTTAMNKLERRGFVKRVRDEEDRRKVLVSLTTQGKKVWRAHEMFHQRMLNDAFEDLTAEEEKVLIAALEKVKGFFDKSV